MYRDEEIIGMAQEAGIGFQSFPNVAGHLRVSTTGSQSLGRLKRLAELIAAKEREACAQVAMLKATNGIETSAAIRARGATDGKPT